MTPVTDPGLLAQLNGSSGSKPVSDPELLAQLNGPSVAADVAKSVGIGIAKGPINAAGFPGDVQSLSGSDYNPFNYLTKKYKEANPERAAANEKNAARVGLGEGMTGETRLPTSADIQSKVEGVTGDFYKPQTRLGKGAEAVTSSLTNPISYLGPGSAGLKIGGAVLSGAGGEAGRQAAEGTKYEIPAQIAGSLAGGAAAVKTLAPSAAKTAVPTYRELKDAATADYNAARNSGLELHPQGVASFASKVEQELSGPNHGFTGGQFGDAPKTFSVLDTLQKPPAGAVVTASNVDAVRKNLGRLSRETVEGKPTPDAAAASVALENLNKYTEAIPQNHILAGDPAEYVRATKQGNANYSAAQRVRNFDAKIGKAENNAAGGIATSLENQIKSQARTILNNPKAQRGWSQDELAALQRVNDGTLGSNILRQAGRGGTGVVPIMGHIGLAAGSGGATLPVQAALAAALYSARKGSEAITKSRARELAEMLAKRSPEYEQRASTVQPFDTSPHRAAIARALLAH